MEQKLTTGRSPGPWSANGKLRPPVKRAPSNFLLARHPGTAPRTRLAGRSAHDAIARQSNDSGAIRSPELPHAACDAIAPDSSKTIPAYAHSLSLRNPGTTIVTAPGILNISMIARTYTGYPKPVTTWVTN